MTVTSLMSTYCRVRGRRKYLPAVE